MPSDHSSPVEGPLSGASPISTTSSTQKRFLNALRLPSFQPRSTSAGPLVVREAGLETAKRNKTDHALATGRNVMSRSVSDGPHPATNGRVNVQGKGASSKGAERNGIHRLKTSPGALTTSPPTLAASLPTLQTSYRLDDLPEYLRPSEEASPDIAPTALNLLPPINLDIAERTIRAPSRTEQLKDEQSGAVKTLRSTTDSEDSKERQSRGGVATTASGAMGKRKSVFDMSWTSQHDHKTTSEVAIGRGLGHAATRRSREGVWLISVNLEAKKRKKGSEVGDIDCTRDRLVVYASTPTGQYTLFRHIKDVTSLHTELTQSSDSPLPPLPPILSDYFGSDVASPTKQERRPSFLDNLQTRWRSTIKGGKGAAASPSRRSQPNGSERSANPMGSPSSLVTIGPFEFETAMDGDRPATDIGAALGLDDSTSSGKTPDGDSSAAQSDSRLGDLLNKRDPTSSPSLDSRYLDAESRRGDKSRHDILTAISAYLSALANQPQVRSMPAWRTFFRVRRNDLASNHTTERVGEGWMEISKSSQGSPLVRTVSTTAKDKRHSSLRKSKSFGGGFFFGDSLRKTLPQEPQEPLPKQEGPVPVPETTTKVDEVILIEKIPDVETDKPESAAVSTEGVEDEAPKPSIIAVTPSQEAPPLPNRPSVNASRRSRSSILLTDSAEMAASPPSSPDSAVEAGAAPDVSKAEDHAQPARTPTFGRHSRLLWRHSKSAAQVTVKDFEVIRVLGRGCAGKVVLVRHRRSGGLFAMKAIVKRHTVALQELQHTLTEQSVLKRVALERAGDPRKNAFLIKLWWSFHDADNLYLVLDFHPGGDLATQLARWGRLGKDRARFYTCEIVEGVECLHAAGVIYRDLKPENALLGADGHIVLVDFGLAAEFPGSKGPAALHPTWMTDKAGTDRFSSESVDPLLMERDAASSFVGTAEYLAPEILLAQRYSYEVDWWSLGTMLYEALLGNTPFWAENTNDMYARVLYEELYFPSDRSLDRDTRSFIRGLLQKDPRMRLTEPRIKTHPYLRMLDWDLVRNKRYIPPYIPPQDPDLEYDIQNFDDAFLSMEPTLQDEEAQSPQSEQGDAKQAAAIDHSAFDGYTFCDQNLISAVLEEEAKPAVAESPAAAATVAHPQAETDIAPTTSEAVEPTAEILSPMNVEPPRADTLAVQDMPPLPALKATKTSRHSRELSGIEALDRGLDLTPTTSNSATDDNSTDQDLDEEWDVIDEDQQVARNGRRVRDTLFARGVVDRYKLAVLKRKESSMLKRSASKPRRSPSSSLFLGANGSARGTGAESPSEGTPPSSLGSRIARLRLKPKRATSDMAPSPELMQVLGENDNRPQHGQRTASSSTGQSQQSASSGGSSAAVPPPLPDKEGSS